MMLGFEIWFWAAAGGAVLAGLSNFYFKQAAARGYSAELFSLYGGVISVVFMGGVLLLWQIPATIGWVPLFVFVGGLLAAVTGILKVYALRNIDATIYFPLFKLLAPALAIVLGIVFFAETFSVREWIGMVLGLMVPLLLITKSEKGRQQNLLLGLLLVLVTGVLSALIAAVNKYATDALVPAAAVVWYVSLGVIIGSVLSTIWRKGWQINRNLILTESSWALVRAGGVRAILISASMVGTFYAYVQGGSLAVVQTIHSFYILIPIVMAIVLYNEHWNIQKAVAIILSVAALALLG